MNDAKFIPPYSVDPPDTNSDSDSDMSKRLLLHSDFIVIIYIIHIPRVLINNQCSNCNLFIKHILDMLSLVNSDIEYNIIIYINPTYTS